MISIKKYVTYLSKKNHQTKKTKKAKLEEGKEFLLSPFPSISSAMLEAFKTIYQEICPDRCIHRFGDFF